MNNTEIEQENLTRLAGAFIFTQKQEESAHE